ncbi:hypothetical protein VP1G_11220 [Cytospora mali]|uniref:Uncharacterized protein n=1 Tax=Cytospora mali TaxID=578113 RepID=A0A194VBI4_CYTMA|nr:hypothetical protein VP1G_11220 [Valsa mali var. pyri (nom. inval.)]
MSLNEIALLPRWLQPVDHICLVPSAHKDKFDLSMEISSAVTKAGASNVLFLRSNGADYSTKEKQPGFRESVELENAAVSVKGDLDVRFWSLALCRSMIPTLKTIGDYRNLLTSEAECILQSQSDLDKSETQYIIEDLSTQLDP